MDRRVRRAVLDRLSAVEEMAARAGATLSAPLARRHIQTITDGWRELLVQHQPDPTGRCPVCTPPLSFMPRLPTPVPPSPNGPFINPMVPHVEFNV